MMMGAKMRIVKMMGVKMMGAKMMGAKMITKSLQSHNRVDWSECW